jgi:hypothetical protein
MYRTFQFSEISCFWIFLFFVGTNAQDFNSDDFLELTPCVLLEKYQYYGETTVVFIYGV